MSKDENVLRAVKVDDHGDLVDDAAYLPVEDHLNNNFLRLIGAQVQFLP